MAAGIHLVGAPTDRPTVFHGYRFFTMGAAVASEGTKNAPATRHLKRRSQKGLLTLRTNARDLRCPREALTRAGAEDTGPVLGVRGQNRKWSRAVLTHDGGSWGGTIRAGPRAKLSPPFAEQIRPRTNLPRAVLTRRGRHYSGPRCRASRYSAAATNRSGSSLNCPSVRLQTRQRNPRSAPVV